MMKNDADEIFPPLFSCLKLHQQIVTINMLVVIIKTFSALQILNKFIPDVNSWDRLPWVIKGNFCCIFSQYFAVSPQL